MLIKIVETGQRGINICCMTDFCTMLTSCVFQLVSFAFCFYRKRMEGDLMGHFVVKKNQGCTGRSLLLVKNEVRCGALCVVVHDL
jgi:hypothetical protein